MAHGCFLQMRRATQVLSLECCAAFKGWTVLLYILISGYGSQQAHQHGLLAYGSTARSLLWKLKV